MIRLNGVEFEYREGVSLTGLIESYNLSHANIGFDDCVVIINGAAISAQNAREWRLCENDTIIIAPILDGG